MPMQSTRFYSLILMMSLPLISISLDFPNENRIIDPNIHTVLLHKEGFEMAMPIILLNSDQRLELTFDDLDVSLKQYRFTIRHCTSEWETSEGISVSDYIDGVTDESIDDFSYSYNTTVEYIHYKAFIPSQNLRPRLSGNYLLIVFTNDPGFPVFTRRFMVVEPSPVSVVAEVIQSETPMESISHQQVSFLVNHPGLFLSNPQKELKIIIMQNERWDNAIRNPKPRFVRSSQLDFSYDPSISFGGGNEFRTVDIKSLRYQSENIRVIDWDGAYQVYLLEDQSRARKPYILYKDINGRMVIENDEYAENSEVEADYAWVHFSLPSSAFIPGGKLYVIGALTDYRLAPPNEMVYDPKRKAYQCSLLLKQGYYGYIYVFTPEGSSVGDQGFFEGNHWETENQYTIFVYYHPLSGLYDQLIAIQDVSSKRK